MITNNELHKLISLTFDENTDVRKNAADKLSKYDDPAAVFALVELSYDKDESVRNFVIEILKSRHPGNAHDNKNVMSFADIFGSNGNQHNVISKKNENNSTLPKRHKTKREKLMEPIVKLFERQLGKEKAKVVSKKLMPTLEKIYDRAINSTDKNRDEEHRRMMQAVLTQYLAIVGDVGSLKAVNVPHEQQELLEDTDVLDKITEHISNQKEPSDSKIVHSKSAIKKSSLNSDNVLGEISEVSGGMDANALENDIEIINKLEQLSDGPSPEELYGNNYKTFFGKVYEIMLATDGDEKIMKNERKRLITETKRDIELAFRVARDKFRAKKIVLLPNLRDGMRNVYTDTLTVKEMSTFEYGKRKKKQGMSIIVQDADENEGLLYLFDDRGSELQVGMHVKIEKGYVRTFEFSNQTALTIGKVGSVYIVV